MNLLAYKRHQRIDPTVYCKQTEKYGHVISKQEMSKSKMLVNCETECSCDKFRLSESVV